MERASLKSHFEKMNHEFSRIDFYLEKYGYKLDGCNGIKVFCKSDSLKSADYIEDKTEKIAFVEFTDLRRQYHQMLGDIERINNIGIEGELDEEIIQRIQKKLLTSVTDEIKSKFKDTAHLIGKIDEFYNDKPESFGLKPWAIVVIAPDSDDDQPCRKIEISRKLDRLKSQLTSCLPAYMFHKVVVCDIGSYARR